MIESLAFARIWANAQPHLLEISGLFRVLSALFESAGQVDDMKAKLTHGDRVRMRKHSDWKQVAVATVVGPARI